MSRLKGWSCLREQMLQRRSGLTWFGCILRHAARSLRAPPVHWSRDCRRWIRAAWAMSLRDAMHANDVTRLQAVSIAMAKAQRFDIYWNTIVLRTSRALIKTRSMDSVQSVVLAYGVGAALAIPSYQTISASCKDAMQKPSEQLEACRHLATMLRNGDTYLTEMIGTLIAKRSWPDASPEFQDAVAARRIVRYRMDVGFKADEELGINNKWAELNLRLLEETRTEQKVALGLIKAAGLNPVPPADWVDSKP